ncbi:hypothetical protein EGW08_022936 [Elysia chlorotica]|uniref:Uncharacterized protein n=1 Tax=Elysia chlorotica TaxID=188477 RepID=A0A3S0Z4N6_ELYCH|nr:hypothetical protein EGW08_022936 [Elysia chlorotica]
MAPTLKHHAGLNGPGTTRCSTVGKGGNCAFIFQVGNHTMDGNEETAENGSETSRNDEGAMKFIIAVLLVYSLLGTAGSMILRFRQSAAKRKRNGSIEASDYLKQRDQLKADCHRARLLQETNRVLNNIHTFGIQRSGAKTTISANNGDIEGLEGRASLSVLPLLNQSHPNSIGSTVQGQDAEQHPSGIYSRPEQRPMEGPVPGSVWQSHQAHLAVIPELIDQAQSPSVPWCRISSGFVVTWPTVTAEMVDQRSCTDSQS